MTKKFAFESLLILSILIAAIAIIPNDPFNKWYFTNRAQITVTHNVRYFNDEIVGNLFSWISENLFVPAWNFLFANDAIRNFVAPTMLAGIIGGLAYDVVKSAMHSR